jgi:hypothetical protein
MKSTQYPLQVPEDLMAEVESTANTTHLSKADVMRQAMKLGLPRLRKQLSVPGRVTNVEPLPKAVLARIYSRRDDDEDLIRTFIKAQSFKGED